MILQNYFRGQYHYQCKSVMSRALEAIFMPRRWSRQDLSNMWPIHCTACVQAWDNRALTILLTYTSPPKNLVMPRDGRRQEWRKIENRAFDGRVQEQTYCYIYPFIVWTYLLSIVHDLMRLCLIWWLAIWTTHVRRGFSRAQSYQTIVQCVCYVFSAATPTKRETKKKLCTAVMAQLES